MMWSSRRAFLVLLAVGVLALASCLPNLLAQKGLLVQKQPLPPAQTLPTTPAMNTDFADTISLPTDPKRKAQLQAALDNIEEGNWEVAADILQKLLLMPEDVFVQLSRKGPDGKETKNWTSVKSEANHIIATQLTPAGLEVYNLKFGPTAARMLKEAKESGDINKLKEVMNYYLHTESGAEATNLLGTYFLDRGTYISASLCFERLLKRENIAKVPSVTLFKAVYAFHQAGDTGLENQVWKELNSRGGQIAIGQQRLEVGQLQEYVASLDLGRGDRGQYDWGMPGGNPSRNGKGEGDTPFMEYKWPPIQLATMEQTKAWLAQAAAFQNQRKIPILPAAMPITATISKDNKKIPLVIFRSHSGVHAINVKTGERFWQSGSGWSIDAMVKKAETTTTVTNWVNYYQQTLQRPNVLFENSTIGTLSTDNTYAYVVDDLAVSPPPNQQDFNQFQQPGGYVRNSDKVTAAIGASRLQAYDLATGKLKWELGGSGEKAGDLADSYFLGPPVPIAGRLYLLTEKQQELRLVCIDPAHGQGHAKVVATQTLASTRDKMQQDVLRRMQAAHLSFGEGMLVCPTNAGAILGVDLLSNSLVWAYPYREKSTTGQDEFPNQPWRGRPGFRGGVPPGFQMLPDGRIVPIAPPNTHWQVTPPIIQEGKVVFTAPDAKSVHCLNLRDGSKLWVHNRNEDDLYLAGVFNGKVLIVGKRNIRALSLSKGELMWSLEVGSPSGQGVASENIYYLPLKEAVASKKPEICAIDIDRGVVHAHTKSRKDIVPGNLLFYDGDVLSQTTTELMAFPQLKVKLAQIDELIKKNPMDPVGLMERGELRLDKGDLQGAIDDLSLALKNNPPKEILGKTRGKLYETLTEYFQRDFNGAEKYLKEYEELCSVDMEGATKEEEKVERQNESRRRRANFLCLVAKGKETQGKLVEAFERYMEFSALAGKDELISVIDEPSVRAAPDVWSQGRIRAMADAAKPEHRKPLEDRIIARWNELQKKNSSSEELRQFVNVFGSLFTVGKEARLQLAERLMDDPDPLSLLEAERHLSLLRGRNEDPRLAARAVECLARLNTRKGMLRDAAFYYRILRRDYGGVVVIDGKTGADVYDDQATDKRLLPFMDEPDRLGAGKDIKVPTPERGNFVHQVQTYQLGQVGENLPFFQENQVVLRFQPSSLKLLDRGSGDEKWSENLVQTNIQHLVNGNGQPNTARWSYQSLGHLVVLPLGHMVFGIDAVKGKILWQRNLYAADAPGVQGGMPQFNPQIPPMIDPRDGSVVVTYQDGWAQRLGQTGPLEGNVICLQTREALVGVDPVNGRTLWTRSDVGTRNRIFGDDQIIYVVELNAEGKPSSTRALRAYDGVSVKIPDFSALFAEEKRVQMDGRNLLVSEPGDNGTVVLRLYDVLTGQDLLKESFPAGSIALKSENSHLGGMVAPDGRVKIIDLRTRKVVVDYKANPQHFAGATAIYLVADRQDYFLAVNSPIDPQILQFGGVNSNLLPGTGLRALPVNGYVYSFNGSTGKLRWYFNMPNQTLILEQFEDMPMVLFSSRYQTWSPQGVGRTIFQIASVRAIKKSNGKMIYGPNSNKPEDLQSQIPPGMFFHAITVDARHGKVDMVGQQMKIVFDLNGGAETK
jgi:outer membrane protein assembly factor BamB